MRSYIDPKDGEEHVNHGMLEYSKEDLELHNDAFHAHEENEENLGGAKINDWHTRHEDQHLEVYCDNHPDLRWNVECTTTNLWKDLYLILILWGTFLWWTGFR